MEKISPNYRTDSDSGLDRHIKEYLDKHYLQKLKNLDKINPKLLVVFSGGNAMGKTTISNKIEARFAALVIENDAIKRHLVKLLPTAERDELNRLTWLYSMGLYKRLDKITSNGLIVRDGLIDWYYDRILPIFEQANYSLFIIGFSVSRPKAKELIETRGDTPTVKEERFYKLLDYHPIHIKRFRKIYKPDIILTDDNLFDHELVLNKLEQKLKEIRT